MGELTKEIAKAAILGKSDTSEALSDLYFNDLSPFIFIRGVKNSRYYHISKDLINLKNNLGKPNFVLRESDLHPYTVSLLQEDKNIKEIFHYKNLDQTMIDLLIEAIKRFDHYSQAVMIARIIEREERVLLITTLFAIAVPLATIILGITTLILTIAKVRE